jgi:hypothetical protein
MSTQVTVTLPDEVYRDAERLAQQTGRDVANILSTALEISLSSLRQPVDITRPVDTLTDEDVLALAEGQMDALQNARMSALLEKQQSDELDEVERHELSLLLYIYQGGSMRKAQGFAEAVRRGLKPS